MMIQNQILGTLRKPGSERRLGAILRREPNAGRIGIARRVCEVFGFLDARGKPQLSGCLKALGAVERSGRIPLPASRVPARPPSPRRLEDPVAAALKVPAEARAVEGLSLVRVATVEQRKLWNTLLHFEHPQGTATFAGCQMRYLVASDHGVLGALGFSSSALQLGARDAWIGWSAAQRQAHLHRVVCLSRFLIRPGVRCRNLASHVLGLALRRLPMDFEERYGYRPWLVETFVAPEFEGTCFKAANFVRVGCTAGRGRQDIGRKHAKSVKSVYMFSLEPNWRQRLDVPFVDAAPSLEPGEGLDSGEWARNEFGGAPLGDQRLSARLVNSVDLLASIPGQPITGNPEGNRAAVKGYYRMIDQPEESAVTPENILAPHRARTVQRMRDQDTVLCIQDGTDLNFATRPACGGLEIIGHNQTSAKTRGLHLHLTLATTGEGLPLGILRCGFDPPNASGAGSEAKHGNATEPGPEPRAGKDAKTQRWIQGLQDAGRIARELTGKTRVISVMDREADFYELFDEQRRIGRVEVLVRARHNRILEKGAPKLFAALRNQLPGGQVEIEIDRLTERPKSSRKEARPARSKRRARVEVRFRRFDLPSTVPGTEPVPMSVVHLRETNPPDGEKPLEWFLLTSLHVDHFEAAVEIIGFYLRRWRIEDLFRVLKSGCKVEDTAFRSACRLQRAATIDAVIAWRIMLMTLLGRELPECPAELMFTDSEIHFLEDYAHTFRLNAPQNLGAAVLLVAILGGYQNRKHDPPPGNKIMWRGIERLTIANLAYRVAEARSAGRPLVQNE